MMKLPSNFLVSFALALAAVLAATTFPAAAQNAAPAAEQLLYLPVYSHIYYGELDRKGQPNDKLLSVHVSIRNTDMRNSIKVMYARYYDTDGKLLKDYLPAPRTIPPLGTAELFIPRSDASGGSGANFLIAWKADAGVNPPLAEAIHTEFEVGRTLIFTTQGQPIKAR
jgi:hypothetical protein